MAPSDFEHIDSIDSTSLELMRRPLLAPADQQASRAPILLLADRQLAGRGRNGRRWLSDGQQTLTFSVAIERNANRVLQLGFPLAVGVALAQVLAGHGARPLLKWPNDLYCEVPGGVAKAGGILVEVRHIGHLTRTVVGCGLNLAAAPASADLGQPVTAFFDGASVPARVPLAQEFGAAICAAFVEFEKRGLTPFLKHWRRLDMLAGHPIDLLRPDGQREPARALGVDDDGALIIERAAGSPSERIISGEVGVRRRAAGDPNA
jgi:BirA family biotin operon repressor/biotin-[acetyl-CoA-carboxylase] ligase